MTYKLEPGLSRIISPIKLIFPDHTETYSSGAEVCRAVFDHRYVVREIRAVEGTVEIRVDEMDTPAVSPIGEETFF